MSGRVCKTRLKPKQLESYLDQLEGFKSPNVDLEQYQTPAHIASQMLWIIDEHYTRIEGKTILDLGCGVGTLGIGCILLGAKRVVGVDVDPTALATAQENVTEFELPEGSISFVQKDVREISADDFEAGTHFDMALMNPPFGTKGRAGIDALFVQKALSLTSTVYSLHKSSTRDFWKKTAKEWGASAKPLEKIVFNLDASYFFHRERSRDIMVDLVQFTAQK